MNIRPIAVDIPGTRCDTIISLSRPGRNHHSTIFIHLKDTLPVFQANSVIGYRYHDVTRQCTNPRPSPKTFRYRPKIVLDDGKGRGAGESGGNLPPCEQA